MSLVCFQTFSIGKNVPCLFVIRFRSRAQIDITHIADCSMLSRYHNTMFVRKYLFFTTTTTTTKH